MSNTVHNIRSPLTGLACVIALAIGTGGEALAQPNVADHATRHGAVAADRANAGQRFSFDSGHHDRGGITFVEHNPAAASADSQRFNFNAQHADDVNRSRQAGPQNDGFTAAHGPNVRHDHPLLGDNQRARSGTGVWLR